MATYLICVMALSMFTLNCNGIQDQSKRAGLVQWLRSLPVSVDVVCLQETHCVSSGECSSWFSSSGFCSLPSPGSAHSCSCIVLYRPSLSMVKSWSDDDGRFLQCEFSYLDRSFLVCCIYGPNRNPARDQFLDYLHPMIDPSVPTILAGDFNIVFDRAIDRFRSDPADSSRESSSSLRCLFEACCVIDVWRYLHPSTLGFTWTRWDGTRASRIDIIGVPYVWVSSVSCCDILPCPFSDHCAVLLTVSIPDVVPPGPGLWKLNTSILEDEDYVKSISEFWIAWRSSILRFPSLAKWWEEGKTRIKGITIRYCCARSSAQNRNRDLLVGLIDHLKTKIDSRSTSCLGPYHSALAELATLDSNSAKGAQVRSRARWIDEGESSSAYFFRLEMKCSADCWISGLRESDGSIMSSPPDLCRCLSSFYCSLFTAVPSDPSVQSSLLRNVSSSLDPDETALCEGHLTPEECLIALQGVEDLNVITDLKCNKLLNVITFGLKCNKLQSVTTFGLK